METPKKWNEFFDSKKINEELEIKEEESDFEVIDLNINDIKILHDKLNGYYYLKIKNQKGEFSVKLNNNDYEYN